jgi:hypothetical protein
VAVVVPVNVGVGGGVMVFENVGTNVFVFVTMIETDIEFELSCEGVEEPEDENDVEIELVMESEGENDSYVPEFSSVPECEIVMVPVGVVVEVTETLVDSVRVNVSVTEVVAESDLVDSVEGEPDAEKLFVRVFTGALLDSDHELLAEEENVLSFDSLRLPSCDSELVSVWFGLCEPDTRRVFVSDAEPVTVQNRGDLVSDRLDETSLERDIVVVMVLVTDIT